MAAQPIAPVPELFGLREVAAAELAPILLEETVEWRQRFDWDFSRSADLVRRFAEIKALDGAVLMDRGELVGYGYSVLENNKGLVGDLYVRPAWRQPQQEARLLRHMLDHLMALPTVRRIESQLMIPGEEVGRAIQRERFIRLFERKLMMLHAGQAQRQRSRPMPSRFRIDPWSDINLDAAAGIISLAYHDHIDSQINDQYRSVDGARRFLNSIVQFPGCGTFFRPASFIGVDLQTGWAAGAVLSSFVAEEIGHITQLCIAPKFRSNGLGGELLHCAIDALVQNGAKQISLTVTAENAEAVALYQRLGFVDQHRFFAYVWDAH